MSVFQSVQFNLSVVKKTRWYEFAIRFAFGGAITVIAGLLAQHCGPIFGGLFLAFPAIFPATATLIEKHEREKKQRAGMLARDRPRHAAALDARGAAIGSLSLALFGVVVWQWLDHAAAPLVIAAALVLWLVVSLLLWRLSKTRLCAHHRAAARHHPSANSRTS